MYVGKAQLRSAARLRDALRSSLSHRLDPSKKSTPQRRSRAQGKSSPPTPGKGTVVSQPAWCFARAPLNSLLALQEAAGFRQRKCWFQDKTMCKWACNCGIYWALCLSVTPLQKDCTCILGDSYSSFQWRAPRSKWTLCTLLHFI